MEKICKHQEMIEGTANEREWTRMNTKERG